MNTVLPDPVAPTSASVSPGAISRLDVVQHVGVRVREAEADAGEPQPPLNRAELAAPSVISFSASKISAIRSAAVIASCAMASRKPSAATGQTSDNIKVMKATRVPRVTLP